MNILTNQKWTSLGCEKMARTDNAQECAVKTAGVGTGFAGTVVYTKDVRNTTHALVTRTLNTSTAFFHSFTGLIVVVITATLNVSTIDWQAG